jgi:hypothetical protein
MASTSTTSRRERRGFQRFRIECEVQYRVIGIDLSGSGKTLNMSRNGVLLAIDRLLSPGLRVEVEIDWPVRVAGKIPMKLAIKGRIVRSQKNHVVVAGMTISWYEFRTVADQSAT